MNRRSFLAATSTMAVSASLLRSAETPPLHLATNTYPWGTFAQREGKAFPLHTDESLAAIAATGLQGYEPIINSPDDFAGLAKRLTAHGLEMRSLYVNSVLHDESRAKESIAAVLAIARPAADIGTRIIVTNPSPIKWGGIEDKSDAELIVQAAALNELGRELRKLGITLAYHNHDSELRQGAREFHHMLTATEAENVKFCLDAHWVFRGCGNSQLALFDSLKHYGERVVELHLRQSKDGIWTELFTGTGDIDYGRLAGWLRDHQLRPHLVLEQAVEKGSPQTMNGVEAHRRSRANAAEVFSSL